MRFFHHPKSMAPLEAMITVHQMIWVMVGILILIPSVGWSGRMETRDSHDGKPNVPAERPFDAVNIFGDFYQSERLPDTSDKKLWWVRVVRGEVGKERFLLLCALKDGHWKKAGEIRDYVEFQTGENYRMDDMHKMLLRMGGLPGARETRHRPQAGKTGEGWLEKNPETVSWTIDTEWRIEPSVLPLLYFLLMSCPENNRCD